MEHFQRESDMIQPVLENRTEYLSSGHWECFLECVGFPGIADVVFVRFDSSAVEQRLASGLGPITNDLQARVFHALGRCGCLSGSELALWIGCSMKHLRYSVLPELLRAGYVGCSSDGYFLELEYQPVVDQVIAIEVKRQDWVRGIYQARRYQRFANSVLLAIDHAYVHRVLPYLNELKEQRIGLVSVDARLQQLTALFVPIDHLLSPTVDQAVVGERLWATLDPSLYPGSTRFAQRIALDTDAIP